MTEEEQKQEMQKHYMELQFLDQQIKQGEQNIQLLDSQLLELGKMVENISDMKTVDKKSKLFSPIGNGIYVESEVTNTEHLFVNIGANVIAKKTPEEATKIVEKQQGEVRVVIDKVKKELHNLTARFQDLQLMMSEVAMAPEKKEKK